MAKSKKQRSRRPDQLRPLSIERGFPTNAAGSVMIAMGETRVLCTASISSDTPKWLLDKETGQPARGWVTAEYNMMPGSTTDRKKRGPDSRGTEIQRLIARSLRAAVDLDKMPGLMITCDCDVIKADGGTRTAAITGAFVALADAIAHARAGGLINTNPIHGPIAAVSVGVIDGQAHLDLDYALDVRAEVDMNVVMNHKGQFVEVQGTGEAGTFTRGELDTLLDLAGKGIKKLIGAQRKALKK
ncbi:MAG: ribonuclease PH [Phycisphaera sp.]|nr:ribonuclease PH [Phycisphaera sp.]